MKKPLVAAALGISFAFVINLIPAPRSYAYSRHDANMLTYIGRSRR